MIAHTSGFTGLNLEVFKSEELILIQKWMNEALEYASKTIKFNREDYKEFAVLVKCYLEGSDNLKLRRPGAIHRARWMAKVLYSIKLVLLENEITTLPPGTITTAQQVTKLRDLVLYISLIHFKWWACCGSPVDAPWNDLSMYQDIIRYEVINCKVSKSAKKAFDRQLWYLTAEMVPLALFSNKVPMDERCKLATKMLEVKPDTFESLPEERFGNGFGKPAFPSGISLKTSLSDLVSIDSWFIFNLLKLNESFLTKPVKTWARDPTYLEAENKVSCLNVTNDAAERAVKLSFDFLSSSKSEGKYQDTLQVVEKNRNDRPNLRKNEYNNIPMIN